MYFQYCCWISSICRTFTIDYIQMVLTIFVFQLKTVVVRDMEILALLNSQPATSKTKKKAERINLPIT
uniref:Uncharacterized protein n=1 Tax=Anguilla anguilla TaxID=7936 RepID=A0A0E9S2E7_ANGAN